IYEQYYYQPNGLGNADNAISNNDITATMLGYGTNERASQAAATVLTGNTFTLTGGAGSQGVQIFNIYKTNGITPSNTTIAGATATGILVSGANASAVITGNSASVLKNLIGIDVDGGSATITNNHISSDGTGIRFTNGGSGSVSGNNFDGGASPDNGADLRIDSTAGAVTIGAANVFAADSLFIDNQSSQD